MPEKLSYLRVGGASLPYELVNPLQNVNWILINVCTIPTIDQTTGTPSIGAIGASRFAMIVAALLLGDETHHISSGSTIREIFQRSLPPGVLYSEPGFVNWRVKCDQEDDLSADRELEPAMRFKAIRKAQACKLSILEAKFEILRHHPDIQGVYTLNIGVESNLETANRRFGLSRSVDDPQSLRDLRHSKDHAINAKLDPEHEDDFNPATLQEKCHYIYNNTDDTTDAEARQRVIMVLYEITRSYPALSPIIMNRLSASRSR